MHKETILKLHKRFDSYSHSESDIEYWLARELQELLGYDKWENFLKIITKAMDACNSSGNKIPDHFLEIRKMVKIGSGASRDVLDFKLTRYACYLIAQNGDPSKEEIAFSQTYFALQTRKQELLEERILLRERIDARKSLIKSETELSKLIFERGVDAAGFARIRSKGDEALFGGHTTSEMKNKLGVPEKRPLADFLPTVTIAAKNLATELTNFNVRKDDLNLEPKITTEHVKNNNEMREVLAKNNIYPENLPPEEDLKKLENKLTKNLVKKKLNS